MADPQTDQWEGLASPAPAASASSTPDAFAGVADPVKDQWEGLASPLGGANVAVQSGKNQNGVQHGGDNNTDPGFLTRVGKDLSKRNDMVNNAVGEFGVGPSSLLAGVGKGVAGSA